MHAENSDLYNIVPLLCAVTAKFSGEPNINWEISKE
jgi:hypothetical protein